MEHLKWPFHNLGTAKSRLWHVMAAAGLAGLFVALTVSIDCVKWLSWSNGLLPHVGKVWLVLQRLAVIAGVRGAWQSTSFALAALGIASSLVVVTL